MSIAARLPSARLEGNIFHVSAFGRDWTIRRCADLEELWARMDAEDFEDERIPYWTELWPASLALGQWLFMNGGRIRGKICLDLGCGLGFTAILGQWLGARMLACDYELAPLLQGRRNAALNQCGQPAWLAMDWRQPGLAPGSIAHIWAGDILYEKRAMEPVLDFLDWSLAADGTAWLAEPGRAIFSHFLELAKKRGWSMKQRSVREVWPAHPQKSRIAVTIWEAARP